MKYSAVIPVFNEQESLRTLHTELRAVAVARGWELEIVFVDDGSTDDSWRIIESLAAEDSLVSGVRFRRNFGKAAALMAGFAEVDGDVVFTLDADLQDDPKELPRFVEALEKGHDVVSGWKTVRHDPWHKTIPSRVFNRMVGWLTGVKLHDHNCGFKAYRGEVLPEIHLYGELHRFVPVLAAARGFRIGEISVEHRARKFGRSKYGFERFLKGFLDLTTVYFLTGYGSRPQHLLGSAGLASFSAGLLGLFYLTVYWLVREFGGYADEWALSIKRPLVLYSLGAMLLSAQLLSLGFLAELITAQNAKSEVKYSVRARVRGATNSKTRCELSDARRIDDLDDPASLHHPPDSTPDSDAS